MNDETDNELAERVQKAMSNDASQLDQNVARKLHAARYLALEKLKPGDRAKPLFGLQKVVPGSLFAFSILVIVGLGLVYLPKEELFLNGKPDEVQAMIHEIDNLEISSAEFELVEELEFYEWLEVHGHAG